MDRVEDEEMESDAEVNSHSSVDNKLKEFKDVYFCQLTN